MRAIRLVFMQILQYRKHCHPNVPEWYETRRKTTHVIFWQ